MAQLHDAQCKTEILRRLQRCGRMPQRRWGKMSVGQMLWHVNEAMEGALGRIVAEPMRVPLPRPLLKFLVLNAAMGEGGADAETMDPASTTTTTSRPSAIDVSGSSTSSRRSR